VYAATQDVARRLRIFVADDHAIVREGLKALINARRGMTVVGEAGDGLSACAAIPTLRPDVAIIDVSMPGLSGAETVARIRQVAPDVRILAYSVHEDRSYLRGVLHAGAAGYALKRGAAEDILQAITVVARGGTYLDPALAEQVIGSFIRPPADATVDADTLSAREAEVLQLVAAGHSTKEIAARLAISGKTVETYRSRAVEKLKLHSRADIVRYAIARNWLGRSS
jgi:DNA-binding NarL/FixJ family response regulator